MTIGLRTVLGTALLLTGAAVAVAGSTSRLALAPGDAAPLITGSELSTGEARTADWAASRLTLVNFWATWCVPCQEEMPSLQQLHERHAGDGLSILGVHRQAEATDRQIHEFVQTFGVTYPILRISPRIAAGWRGLSALPASFLVDARGVILRRYIGATPAQVAGLVADVEAALAGRPLAPQVVPQTGHLATEGGAAAEVYDPEQPAEP